MSGAFDDWMKTVQAGAERDLSAYLPAAGAMPTRLHEAMRYALLGGGKRVRPLLVFAAGALFDADAAVHRLQGPGGALVAAIESAFPGTTGANGVDRAALGQRVLADPAALARLEAILGVVEAHLDVC